MEKTAIFTGTRVEGSPYSPGIAAGNLIFVSGQIPTNFETKEVERDSFEEAVKHCILNVERVLKGGGAGLENVVKCTVFLKDMNNFSRLNAVYSQYFGDIKPARSCVEVARLPLDVDVEIEAIAVLP